MPPKQKQVKKGPTYKPPVPAKDIVPADIKEPPREPKPFKIPDSFPEPPKNSEPLPSLFEDWPTQQTIKAHDFGIHTQAKFLDPTHGQLVDYLAREGKAEWHHLSQLPVGDPTSSEQQEEEEKNLNQSKNEIASFREISSQKVQEPPFGASCVIETYMRPQTEEEMSTRLKEQAQKAEKAAKQKKKAAKKQEPKEQGPLQVSDVKMSDVITKKHMPPSAVWIGSQLQLIKQRSLTDVNNNEPIWRKIYPQENGVPQLTRSGKYWVKLLHMGKYIKVEVDDRFPIDEQARHLFPLSRKRNEKWTLILTKALTKYLSRVRNDAVVGNGLVAYALTGMVAETIPLSEFNEWQRLEELTSNEHYTRKDMVVTCFSNDNSKAFTQLTLVPQQTTEVKGQQVRWEEEGEGLEEEVEVETKILNGYAYCVGDYFDNDNFNMVFSQEKSQKQMLLKHEYNQLCKISISNKSREEKLEYRKKKKELKEKLAVQERKRLELINRAPIRYHFLKLLGKQLQIGCPYSEKEILLAKKCVLNRLNQPPNYDIPMERQEKDSKSIQSVSHSVIKYKEQNELFPNLHDFSAIPAVQDLLPRPDPGCWLNDSVFLQFFDGLQVLYNPNALTHRRTQLLQSKRGGAFTYEQSKQILVVQKAQGGEQQRKVRLLLGCAYQRSPRDIFAPYTLVQKFDFDGFRATGTAVALSTDISSQLLLLNNQNSVFKLYTMSRGNAHFWISADSPFKLMSIADYLTEFQGYSRKTVAIEYPPVEAKTFFTVSRLRLRQEGQDNTLLVKLLGAKEDFLPNINYRLVALPKGEAPLTSQAIEGVASRESEQLMLCYQYTRFTLQAGVQYYLLVEAQSQQNIPDGSFQILLLAKNEGLTVEQAEQVEPVKFIEKYIPNKYGLICRERIFSNGDNNATITLRLGEYEQVQGGQGGKGAKKGGKEEPATQLIQKPFNYERNIILRILSGDTTLYEAAGVNEVTVPNFKFLSTKTGKEYYLHAKFDLRVWPQAVIRSQKTQRICWVAQVAAQDTLAFVRDTKQEDKQKLTRKSWEDAEPGRAERAKKARRRFLIQLKKERGEALTEQEEAVLNAPRLTRKQILEEQKRNEQAKKAKGGKKDDKKAGKDKKEEVVEEKAPERPPPSSKHNFMNQIKQFLEILENCVVKYEPLTEGEPRIRSAQQLNSIKQATRLSAEDRVGKLIRNIQRRQTMKLREKEKKQALSIFYSEAKAQFKEKYTHYIEWRAQDAERDKARQDKERQLIDIINQEKPTITEQQLKKVIAEYRDIAGNNPHLADVADMVRKNIRIHNITERMSTLLVGWQVQELKNIGQEIKNDRIQGIDPEVMRQWKEMQEQIQKNPNIVTEKQAQAKKAKKGGKK